MGVIKQVLVKFFPEKLLRYAAFNRYRAKKTLRMMTTDSSASMKIARAINETLDNTITHEEKAWIKRIEELRNSLKNSSEQITVTDYGAGLPNANRSEKEMLEGVVSSKKISDFYNVSQSSIRGTILFKLIREFGSISAIELGTCIGISAAYQAAAQKLNGMGKITTLEGSDSAILAQNNLQLLELDNVTVVKGRFQDNLDSVLQENNPVDYAFIDGHHEEKATIAYFTQLLPYLAGKAMVVFDDISWSKGMRIAWEKIIENERVKIAVDLVTLGICVIDKDIEGKCVYRLPKLMYW